MTNSGSPNPDPINSDGAGRFRHDVPQLTVGQLRAALRDLPDDMVLRAEVASAPSTGHPDPWGDDQFVVVGAIVDDGDYLPEDELILRIDYAPDWYVPAEG